MSRTELRTEVFNYLSPLMDNEQAMQQVLVFLRSIQPTAPCQYSIEEVYEMGMKACEDIHALSPSSGTHATIPTNYGN